VLEIADIGPVDELCKKNKVHRLYIFGSAITDKFTDRSDIDFYVEFWEYNNRSLPLLKKDLQKLFNRRVDLHLKKMKQANYKLIYNSESGGFEKIPTFVETEINMKITILS
jgi:predicted nucleotidyltransferase